MQRASVKLLNLGLAQQGSREWPALVFPIGFLRSHCVRDGGWDVGQGGGDFWEGLPLSFLMSYLMCSY